MTNLQCIFSPPSSDGGNSESFSQEILHGSSSNFICRLLRRSSCALYPFQPNQFQDGRLTAIWDSDKKFVVSRELDWSFSNLICSYIKVPSKMKYYIVSFCDWFRFPKRRTKLKYYFLQMGKVDHFDGGRQDPFGISCIFKSYFKYTAQMSKNLSESLFYMYLTYYSKLYK